MTEPSSSDKPMSIGARALRRFIDADPEECPNLKKHMVSQNRVFVMTPSGSFTSKSNLSHMHALHLILKGSKSPALNDFMSYVFSINNYYMSKISGDLKGNKEALRNWGKGEGKIAKRLYLAWRKTLIKKTPESQETVEGIDPERRIHQPAKRRKTTKQPPPISIGESPPKVPGAFQKKTTKKKLTENVIRNLPPAAQRRACMIAPPPSLNTPLRGRRSILAASIS